MEHERVEDLESGMGAVPEKQGRDGEPQPTVQ